MTRLDLGKLAAYRYMLNQIIDGIRDDKTRDALLEIAATMHKSCGTVLKRDPSSDFLKGMMESFEVIQFAIREGSHLPPGQDSGSEEVYFVCVKCNFPLHVMPSDFNSLCPGCGGENTFHPTHRPI